MSLKEQIKNDLKEAMRAKDEVVLSVLRMLNSAIKNKEVEKRTKLAGEKLEEELEEAAQLSEEEIIEVIASEAKKRKDAISQFRDAGRDELAQQEERELEVLMRYLLEQLSEEELREIVKKVIQELGVSEIKEMGRVMGAVMGQVKGRAEGALVQKIVKEELEK